MRVINEPIRAFVGPNYEDFYEDQFNKLLIGDVPKFSATWNCQRFFFLPYGLFTEKCICMDLSPFFYRLYQAPA
jgi:hypothetical protein